MNKRKDHRSQSKKAQNHEFKRAQRTALFGSNEKTGPEINSQEPAKCLSCDGTGVFGQVFPQECKACLGSGFDCTDPYQVIAHQAARLNKARKAYSALQGQFKHYRQLVKLADDNHMTLEGLTVRGFEPKGKLD